MIVDDGSDAGHEGQSCRHVQVQMERLAEPENTRKTDLAANCQLNFIYIPCSFNV